MDSVVCFVTLPHISLCPLLSCHLWAFSPFVSHTMLSLGVSGSCSEARGWLGKLPTLLSCDSGRALPPSGPGACESPPQSHSVQGHSAAFAPETHLTSDLGTLVTHVIITVQRDKILHSPWKNNLQRELFPWKFS